MWFSTRFSPLDLSQTDWLLLWSYHDNHDPTKENTSISFTGWKQIFEGQVGYKFKSEYLTNEKTPNSVTSINRLNFNQTLQTFINDFYSAHGLTVQNIHPSKVSLLLGINDIVSSSNWLGVTLGRGGINQGISVSLVFVGKISSIHSTQKALYVDDVVLHELGHARGLNATNMSGGTEPHDHTNHLNYDAENNTTQEDNKCVMRSGEVPVSPYVFCGYHQSILKKCLKSEILTTYNPNSVCATFP